MPVEFLNYNLLTDEDYFDAKHLLLGGSDEPVHPMGMVEEFLDESFQISSYDTSMLELLIDDIEVENGEDQQINKKGNFTIYSFSLQRK